MHRCTRGPLVLYCGAKAVVSIVRYSYPHKRRSGIVLNVFWIAIILHPMQFYLVNHSPVATVRGRTLQYQIHVLREYLAVGWELGST